MITFISSLCLNDQSLLSHHWGKSPH